MTVRRLSASTQSFGLSRPFRIARGTKTVAEVILVTVEAGAVTGRGECVPYARYGESLEHTLEAIEAIRPAIEAGMDRATLQSAMPPGAARNAVDCALWDLEARLCGRPVWALAGSRPPAPLATALTIAIDTSAAMSEAAAALAEAPLLKVKLDEHHVEARLKAVRAVAPGPRLIVDPNESWTVEMVDQLGPMLRGFGCDLLEQPVPARIDAGLADLDRAVPICADESVHVSNDLGALAARYSHVNIKLDKTGGLTEALRLLAAARAAGLGVMTGCMVSTSLSMAAALPIAAQSDFVDLDGPFWLRADRPDGVRIDRGWLHPPGHGFWGG
jgi:L-alanine-DL-glutamate epimerase-like enolase superfamily enzyme